MQTLPGWRGILTSQAPPALVLWVGTGFHNGEQGCVLGRRKSAAVLNENKHIPLGGGWRSTRQLMLNRVLVARCSVEVWA